VYYTCSLYVLALGLRVLLSRAAGRPWNVRLAALVACRDFVRHLSRLHSGAAADSAAAGDGAKPASAGGVQIAPEYNECVAVFIPGDAPTLGLLLPFAEGIGELVPPLPQYGQLLSNPYLIGMTAS
jgi:hypothetical protein